MEHLWRAEANEQIALVRQVAGQDRRRPSLKDLHGRSERAQALHGKLSLAGDLALNGPVNVLLVDDLYQTGASIEAACAVVRNYAKIGKICVAAMTRKH